MEGNATRRQLVRGGLGLAGASMALGAAANQAGAAAASEAQAFTYALEIERVSVIAYRQVLATDVLSAPVRHQLQDFLAHEHKHVAKLDQILRRLGAPLPPGPASVAAAQALLGRHSVHRSLTTLPTQHDCLRLLINVESLSEGAYFAAVPTLADVGLIRTSAEIMGADAQHWTVLSAIQHDGDVTRSVPYPFVAGSP